jgi:hypothetical protein
MIFFCISPVSVWIYCHKIRGLWHNLPDRPVDSLSPSTASSPDPVHGISENHSKSHYSEICWSSIDFGIALTYDTLCISHACFVHHPALGVMVQVGCRTSLQYEFWFTSDKNTPANALLYIASYGLYTSNMAGNRVKLTNFDSRGLNIKISCFIWSDWHKTLKNRSLGHSIIVRSVLIRLRFYHQHNPLILVLRRNRAYTSEPAPAPGVR